jgi:hypothetical protein
MGDMRAPAASVRLRASTLTDEQCQLANGIDLLHSCPMIDSTAHVIQSNILNLSICYMLVSVTSHWFVELGRLTSVAMPPANVTKRLSLPDKTLVFPWKKLYINRADAPKSGVPQESMTFIRDADLSPYTVSKNCCPRANTSDAGVCEKSLVRAVSWSDFWRSSVGVFAFSARSALIDWPPHEVVRISRPFPAVFTSRCLLLACQIWESLL